MEQEGSKAARKYPQIPKCSAITEIAQMSRDQPRGSAASLSVWKTKRQSDKVELSL